MLWNKKEKNKPKNISLKLYSFNEEIIFNGLLTNFPIKEELILEKTIEHFEDYDPCFFHRSVVSRWMYFEIEEYLNKIDEENKSEIKWQELPENIKKILLSDKVINRVIVEKI
ncbi:hypothetical protein [Clostridium grantii]|uniref:Uncharacterized protein n=1 Tax=Clostridium grantii DSM 8605 TaxID=1121316 RepID=A0A1M5U3C2_9CLOT|nr:hypothetical protein [Clostridium grantii]SHH57361.1 hypothetical protein SAMN02745207_01548 [Clostridium grantii DSM 8605]